MSTITFLDLAGFPSWGATFATSRIGKLGVVALHFSRTTEDAEGFGYATNESRPELLLFYAVDLRSGKSILIRRFDNPSRASPPFPNIVLISRPKSSKILAISKQLGFFIIDPTTNSMDKLSVKIPNTEALDRLKPLRLSSKTPIIELSAGSLADRSDYAQWISDGKKLAVMYGGLLLVDAANIPF